MVFPAFVTMKPENNHVLILYSSFVEVLNSRQLLIHEKDTYGIRLLLNSRNTNNVTKREKVCDCLFLLLKKIFYVN